MLTFLGMLRGEPCQDWLSVPKRTSGGKQTADRRAPRQEEKGGWGDPEPWLHCFFPLSSKRNPLASHPPRGPSVKTGLIRVHKSFPFSETRFFFFYENTHVVKLWWVNTSDVFPVSVSNGTHRLRLLFLHSWIQLTLGFWLAPTHRSTKHTGDTHQIARPGSHLNSPPNPQPQAFLHFSALTFYRGYSQRVKHADVIAWLHKMCISVQYQFTLQHRVDSSENRCSTGVSCPHITSHTDFPCSLRRSPLKKDCRRHTGEVGTSKTKVQ